MRIWHDRSYQGKTDKDFIVHDYAEDDLHSVRLSFEYTEAQKIENAHGAKFLCREAWNRKCAEEAQRRSAYIFPVMQGISENFLCYQFRKDGAIAFASPDWELFFWCNDLRVVTDGALSGRDYSSTRLSFHSQQSPARHREICSRLLAFLTERYSELDNLSVAVQHKTHFFDDRISREAAKIAPCYENKKGVYQGMEGRFVMTKSGLIFQKKWKRRWGYKVSDQDILSMMWEHKSA